MAVTRTTGGAGNDEDAGNGYVYVCVCVYVYLCVDTRVTDGEQAWQHGSAAHMAVCATQDGRMAVTRRTGSDKEDRQ